MRLGLWVRFDFAESKYILAQNIPIWKLWSSNLGLLRLVSIVLIYSDPLTLNPGSFDLFVPCTRCRICLCNAYVELDWALIFPALSCFGYLASSSGLYCVAKKRRLTYQVLGIIQALLEPGTSHIILSHAAQKSFAKIWAQVVSGFDLIKCELFFQPEPGQVPVPALSLCCW